MNVSKTISQAYSYQPAKCKAKMTFLSIISEKKGRSEEFE